MKRLKGLIVETDRVFDGAIRVAPHNRESRMCKKLFSAAVLLVLLAASPASAQQIVVDLSPYIGVYLPTADVYHWRETYTLATHIITGKHKTGFAFGGRVTFWFSDAFGLEGGLAYGPSDVDYVVRVAGEGSAMSASSSVSASVWRGSLKGMVNLVPSADGPVSFFVGGGLALVGRSGDAYKEFEVDYVGANVVFENEGTTDIGGVLNVGVAFDVSEAIAIRIDVEDYIHSLKQTLMILDESRESDSKLQNDLLLTGGVAIRLGR